MCSTKGLNMAYYHYQCQYCAATTYLYDDGIDDGICVTSFADNCGCSDQETEDAEAEDYFDYFDD